ncbi:RidA family protein [Acaricomes phytoseiuli]|uniref:RidA family protein n=1 Tax=Acaricomes phytoseiuli TaxID=291968 RepID=UPI0003675815|nr:RidA family protein [Acaricomes phytoseiuli]MCW1249672.1 RidA family protein [Acaricomes phytoseiuli]
MTQAGSAVSAVERRLAELGQELPEAPAPLASYVPAVISGDLVFTSGQLPLVGGKLVAQGKVGQAKAPQADAAAHGAGHTEQVVSLEAAQKAAEICVVNALAAVKSMIGDLDRITRVVKLVGFVASAADFTAQPAVINGASDLLGTVLGEAGVHARSAVGVAALPLGAPVEVELIVEFR